MRLVTTVAMGVGALAVGALYAAVAGAQTLASGVTLTPATVVAGSPELIRVETQGAAEVDGEWLGRKIEFFRAKDGHAWLALAGVDVEAQVGSSMLHVTLKSTGGETRDFSERVEIHAAQYRTETLNVEPKFVSPGPDELKRIAAEVALKQKVFGASLAEP